jgi:flagellin-specific chaperone FliS
LAVGDLAGKGRAIGKVLEVVCELEASLDHKVWPELGLNLTRLYGFIQAKVARASLDRTAAPLKDCEDILRILREAFSAAASRPQQPAVTGARRP